MTVSAGQPPPRLVLTGRRFPAPPPTQCCGPGPPRPKWARMPASVALQERLPTVRESVQTRSGCTDKRQGRPPPQQLSCGGGWLEGPMDWACTSHLKRNGRGAEGKGGGEVRGGGEGRGGRFCYGSLHFLPFPMPLQSTGPNWSERNGLTPLHDWSRIGHHFLAQLTPQTLLRPMRRPSPLPS